MHPKFIQRLKQELSTDICRSFEDSFSDSCSSSSRDSFRKTDFLHEIIQKCLLEILQRFGLFCFKGYSPEIIPWLQNCYGDPFKISPEMLPEIALEITSTFIFGISPEIIQEVVIGAPTPVFQGNFLHILQFL